MLKKKNSDIGTNSEIIKITDAELEEINRFSRKKLTSDDVYTFSVVLCDNDIDRDFEYFTTEALNRLAELFVGVTGIYDHDPTAKNQTARIYRCETENLSPQKTEYGEDYHRLVAKAYLPICSGTDDLIAMLDAGIQKEVSVGCSIKECTCSICGESMRSGYCGHKKGETYDGKICCGVLDDPSDAYEWSFTAIPSQRKAGVIKSFSELYKDIKSGNIGENAEKILSKTSNNCSSITINREEYEILKDYIENLKEKSKQSDRYKSILELETVKAGITARTEIESDLLEAMVKGLTVEELIRLKEIFEKKTADILPVASQIAAFGSRSDTKSKDFYLSNSQYEI